MDAVTGRAYLPSEVCAQLGISASTLRRIAQFYEQSFGELPKDARGGRIYPDEAIKHLITARDLVDKGKAATLERALDALAAVGANPDDVLARSIGADPIEQLLIEVKGMAQLLQSQNTLLDDLREELAALKAENGALHDAFKALPKPDESKELKQRVADIEKRNQALRNALELKEQEEQERQRPWWRLWQRRKPTLGGG